MNHSARSAPPRAGRLSSRRASNSVILAVTVASVVAAAFAPTQSTGWPIVDVVYRAAFAVLVTVAASEARRWSWFILTGVTALFARSGLPFALALVALAVAMLSTVSPRRVRRWGAVIGALSVQALLRLPPTGPYGLDAVVTALAVAPVLISSYRLQEHSIRRRLRRTAAAAGFVVVLTAGAAAVVGMTGMRELDRASDAARSGIQAVSQGDPERAATDLQRARNAFDAAHRSFSSPWVAPVRLLTGVNAHVDAVAATARVGASVSLTASTAAIDTDFTSIGVQDKRVDVGQIRALEAPLVSLDAALRDGRAELTKVDRSRLLSVLGDRLDRLDDRLDESIPTLGAAIEAVRVAPDMLGASGPRRYVLAFTTPSEARGVGGFWGFYGELVADQGRLQLVRTGRVTDLNPKRGEPGPELVAPPDYLRRYGHLHPERYLQDIPLSPDFPSVASVIEHLYGQQVVGIPVDGVILLDPYALAELLHLTGPIRVEGFDGELTADNAAEFLVRGQYERYDDRRERGDVLEELAESTFDSLLGGKLRNPARLARLMGPMVEQRRVLAHSRHHAEQELYARLGLAGAFPDAAGRDDLVAVISQNAGNNKIDQFLHRSITYDLTLDPTAGTAAGTLTVDLVNDADPSQLPDYVVRNREDSGQPPGVNWTWLSIYTPFDLESLTVDGVPVPSESGLELGWRVYGTRLAVPANGGRAQVVFRLRGALPQGDRYRLSIWPQPLVNADQVHLVLRTTRGWVLTEVSRKGPIAPEPDGNGHETIERTLEGPDERSIAFHIWARESAG